MEAIKAIAKRTKTGKYKIDLPIINIADELDVLVIVEQTKKLPKKTMADFAGKLQWKGDWLAFQKEIRNEWD